MLLLALGMGLALVSSSRSRGVTARVRRAADQEVALELARFATTEAVHGLRRRADTPGDPVQALFSGAADGSVDLLASGLPASEAEAATLPAYSLLEVSLRAPTRLGPRPGGQPFERRGIAEVTARVQGPTGRPVTLRSEYDYRTSMVLPARPFGVPSVTALIAEDGLLAPGRDAVETFTPVVPEIRRRVAEAGGLVSDLAGRWASLPDAGRAAVQRAIDDFRDDARATAEASAAQVFPGDTAQQAAYVNQLLARAESDVISGFQADVAARLEPFLTFAGQVGQRLRALGDEVQAAADGLEDPPAPPSFPRNATVFTLDDTVDLAALDLPATLAQPSDAARLARDRALADQLEVVRALGEAGTSFGTAEVRVVGLRIPNVPTIDTGPIEATVAALEAAARALASTDVDARVGAVFQLLVDFRSVFVTVGGQAQQTFYDRVQRLKGEAMLRRAHFVFDGPGAAARAASFLAEAAPDAGVVVVRNTAPLEVDLPEVSGRLLLVAFGPAIVRRARVRDPAEDSITLVLYGAADVRADEVDASLVLLGPEVQRLPRARVRGSLVLVDAAAVTGRDLLAGELTYDPALAAGPRSADDAAPLTPEARRTLLSPAPRGRRIE